MSKKYSTKHLYSVISVILLFVLIVPTCAAAHCDRIKFERLSIEHGLSQSSVICILQDSRGFMWFGTADGLNRYDGYEFVVYRYDSQNQNSISGNYITCILEDANSFLWIGIQGGGLNKFDPQNETFTRYQHQADNPQSLSHNIVTSIYEDTEGILWVGTDGGGLNKFDRQNETFTRYQHQTDNLQSISSNAIWPIIEDTEGTLWIGTYEGGLNKFNRKEKTFTRYQHQTDNPHSISNNTIWSIIEDTEGILWIGTGSGLNKFDPQNETFIRYQHQADDPQGFSGHVVKSIYEDKEGVLWIGTHRGGLNKFDRQNETFTRYRHRPDKSQSLSDNSVLSIYEDTGGTLWFGTHGGGLNKYDRKNKPFTHYQHDAGNPNSLSSSSIWSIYEDTKGILWIGTNGGGLNKFDRKNETFTRYLHQADNPQSLSYNSVLSICEDAGGILWFGTHGGGLNKFDRQHETFTRYLHQADNPQSLGDNSVHVIYEDTEGILWIGTYNGGLNKFDRKGETFTRYQYQADNPQSISNNKIWSISEDTKGILWIGTNGGGLNKFDRKNETFTRYQHQADNPQSINNDRIYSVYVDTEDTLWIGTDRGLNKFNRKDEIFTHYTEKDGLPNNVVYGILEDTKGNLWLSTNKGISKFNPQMETFTNYDKRDGLQSDEFNHGAFHSGRSGRMYFGGINGVTEFYPDNIQDNPYIPPVVITDFLLFNKSVSAGETSVLKQSIGYANEIALDYKDYIFAFEFSALNYRQPEKNQFRYQLEGFNEDWIDTDSKNRRATYTNLSPGEYVFRVTASNDDGYWNQEGASVKLIILPPWWATVWFRSTLVMAILFIIVAVYRRRTYEIRKRNIELEQRVKDRTATLETRTTELEIAKDAAEAANRAKSTFLASMSHELRTPLNAILGYAQILQKRKDLTVDQIRDQLTTIQHSGRHLLTLINDVLDLSRIEAQKEQVEQEQFNLPALIHEVMSMARLKVIEKGLACDLECASDLPSLVRTDPRKLRQILINILGNAVKYTKQGGITLRVNHLKPQMPETESAASKIPILFQIEDTGVGISKDKIEEIFDPFTQIRSSRQVSEGVGLGLSICRKLVELMGGTLTVESEVGQGSIFSFEIPIEVVEEVAAMTPSDDGAVVTGYRGERKRLLIADDNETNCSMLRSVLEPLGFEIEMAANGQEAIEKAAAFLPDLILMDHLMPVVDGQEAIWQIRQDDNLNNIKIVGISAAVADKERTELFIADCDTFVSKPVDIDILLDVLETQLGIEWMREAAETVADPVSEKTPAEMPPGEVCMPPEMVLQDIRRLVELGDYFELENIANELAKDNRYTDFIKQIRDYLVNYDEEAIIKYIGSSNC